MNDRDFKDIRNAIINSRLYAWIGIPKSTAYKRMCRCVSFREWSKYKAVYFIFVYNDKWYRCNFEKIKKRISFQTPSKKWTHAPVNNYGLIEQSYLLNHCDEVNIEDIYVNEL